MNTLLDRLEWNYTSPLSRETYLFLYSVVLWLEPRASPLLGKLSRAAPSLRRNFSPGLSTSPVMTVVIPCHTFSRKAEAETQNHGKLMPARYSLTSDPGYMSCCSQRGLLRNIKGTRTWEGCKTMGCCPRLQMCAQRCPHIRKAEKLNEGGGHAAHERVRHFSLS